MLLRHGGRQREVPIEASACYPWLQSNFGSIAGMTRSKQMDWIMVLLWGGCLLWAGSVWFLSSLSPSDFSFQGPSLPGLDKVVHWIIFFGGALFFTAALRRTVAYSWKGVILVSVGALALFGAADEIHQLYTPGRTGGDLYDWLADCFGSVAGVVSVFLVSKWKLRIIRAPFQPQPRL